MIVEKIIERQHQSRRKKTSKSGTDSGKLVMYEKKGIRTDLVAVENYVEALYKHIHKSKRKEFRQSLFTSIKHDPFELLNLLQNSDIGSYEHFLVDMNQLSVLQIDTYLEMENYWKQKEKEESKIEELDSKNRLLGILNNEKPSKTRPKRKRFEFDTKGLSKDQIEEKKKIFRE